MTYEQHAGPEQHQNLRRDDDRKRNQRQNNQWNTRFGKHSYAI
jgi:hypothetical protein